jgi:hypothetical protein
MAEPNIPIASTFHNRAEAEAALSNVIRSNKVNIDNFLVGNTNNLVINERVSVPAGVGVVRQSGTLDPLFSIRLVLRRDTTSQLGYFILTGFVNDN